MKYSLGYRLSRRGFFKFLGATAVASRLPAVTPVPGRTLFPEGLEFVTGVRRIADMSFPIQWMASGFVMNTGPLPPGMTLRYEGAEQLTLPFDDAPQYVTGDYYYADEDDDGEDE